MLLKSDRADKWARRQTNKTQFPALQAATSFFWMRGFVGRNHWGAVNVMPVISLVEGCYGGLFLG